MAPAPPSAATAARRSDPVTLPRLGYRAGAGDVVLDVEQMIGSRLLVQGVSGSGKSTAIRGLLEQTHGRVQHLVIDREGEFATLRAKYPYILAGREGDVPADLASAKLLVRKVMELGADLIVDLSELRLPDQREWVRRGFDELIHLPRDLWHPVLAILDEAHIFAPERGSGESVATEAVINLATLGRKRGYCLVAATQRLSKLHKDCAAELLNKLIGYTDDVDLQRVGDQLGMTKEQRAGLKVLEWGQFYVYGPAVSKQPKLVQLPATATKTPERGKARAPAPAAPAAVKRLLAQLTDLPQQAAEEARSIEDLRRQNAELARRNRQLERGAPAAAPVTKVETVTQRVEVPVLKDGHLSRLEKVVDRLGQFGERTVALGQDVVSVGREITASLVRLQQPGNGGGKGSAGSHAVPASRPSVSSSRPNVPRSTPIAPRQAPNVPAEGVSGPQQRILDALAWLDSIGLDRGDRTQVALLAEASPTSSAYGNNLGSLRTAGLIDYPAGGVIALTDAGRGAAATPERPPTTAELHEALFRRLPGPQVRILQALIEAYPAALDRDHLAEVAGASATSSAYGNNLGALRSLGLIDYPARGQVKARPVLFLEQ
jgi:hypothetical protein